MSLREEENEKEKELIRKLKDELRKPLTDPIKESTPEYYLQNKEKVGLFHSLCKAISTC